MRVLESVGVRVVFAVHSDPLSDADAGGQPQGDPKREISGSPETDRSVSDASMQVDGGADIRQRGHRKPCSDSDEELDEEPRRGEEHVSTIAVLPTGR